MARTTALAIAGRTGLRHGPPSWGHQQAVLELAGQLRAALAGSPCRASISPTGVRLPVADDTHDDVRTVFEPDLLVVGDPAKIDRRGMRGAPDVILEVLSAPPGPDAARQSRATWRRAIPA